MSNINNCSNKVIITNEGGVQVLEGGFEIGGENAHGGAPADTGAIINL